MSSCEGCGGPLSEAVNFCASCGRRVRDAKIVDGRYALEAELGRGGMGVVYRARDVGLARNVALKLISPHLLRDRTALESFKQEARGLAAIRNEHVVQVYAFGPHESSLFFAMELVLGRTLESIIEEHKGHGVFVAKPTALTILRRIADGLDAVHDAGLLHRDVKPENVVIEERTGRPVLIDFGLALKLDIASTSTSTLSGGSPAYAAPEQLDRSRPLSRRSDLYAFACTAFELLTNEVPFARAKSIQELMALRNMEASTPPSSLRPELAPVDATFKRALSADPAARHPSCGELAAELGRKLGAGKSEPPTFAEDDGKGTRPTDSIRTGPPSKVADLNVLIVDDDPFFAKFASHAVNLAFHGTNARIAIANNGADALRDAAEHAPHLVLLDYDMPGMNGVEVLAKLRNSPNGTRARVLVLSATAGEDEHWRFGVLGISDFKRKPIPMRGLLETLDKLTKDAGWRRAAVPKR